VFIKNELCLLKENIDSLSESFFFNPSISRYLKQCNSLIEEVIVKFDAIGPSFAAQISFIISQSIKYLSGSTSNKIPYEIVFSLEKALNDWVSEDHIICTALLDDRDFHFNGIDLKNEVKAIFDFVGTPNLIHIALPKIYRHKYLYGPALYHELGHYIDDKYRISKFTFLVNNFTGTPEEVDREFSHRKEFFADLFSASYVGPSIVRFLNDFAPGHPDCSTHPSTARRVEIIEKFLRGEDCQELNRINLVLKFIKRPTLAINFTIPDITDCFEDIKPYKIMHEKELHGIIPASWAFFDKKASHPTRRWEHLTSYDAEKIINDLVEKSVRNYSVKEKWKNATSN